MVPLTLVVFALANIWGERWLQDALSTSILKS